MLNSILKDAVRKLTDHQIESPRQNAELLLAHVLNCSRSHLHTHPQEQLTADQVHQFETLLNERLTRKPLQYVLGQAFFYTVELNVTPAVLIPRPETEVLVDWVIEHFREHPAPRIVDIGTGSGAIAIAIAANLPQARLIATDISPEALDLAYQNAVENQVHNQIQFLDGDLLQPLDDHPQHAVDAILSNPPYVARTDAGTLAPEVRDHEPHLALFSDGAGTAHHQKLIEQGWKYLHPGGVLALEMGQGQGEILRQWIAAHPAYQSPQTVYDYAQIERFIITNRQHSF